MQDFVTIIIDQTKNINMKLFFYSSISLNAEFNLTRARGPGN
jgi:hypothetical protein